MTTEGELRRENLQLREEKTMLELRQENRELKRQVERMQKGKSPESAVKKFLRENYGFLLLLVLMLCSTALTGYFILSA